MPGTYIKTGRPGLRYAALDSFTIAKGSSQLGSYHYEVWDTKLSRRLKPYFAIQLCCYAELLESLIGKRPECIGVVLGSGQQRKLGTSPAD